MDGISIASAAASLVIMGGKLTIQAHDFFSKVKDCPRRIKNIETDLKSTTDILSQLEKAFRNPANSGLFSLEGRRNDFKATIDGVAEVFAELTDLIGKYKGLGIWRKGKWALTGLDEAMQLGRLLSTQKQNLAFILQLTQSEALASIRHGVADIGHGIGDNSDDLRVVMSQLHVLRMNGTGVLDPRFGGWIESVATCAGTESVAGTVPDSVYGDGSPTISARSSSVTLNASQSSPEIIQQSQINGTVDSSTDVLISPFQETTRQSQTNGTVDSSTNVSVSPTGPVFGVKLQDLFERYGTPVPIVVSSCIQAIDRYRVEVRGVYKSHGVPEQVFKLRALFDSDAYKVDLSNPLTFFYERDNLCDLLKRFFRLLPEPFFSPQTYFDLITAASIEDGTFRRDVLHRIINTLPDPNYATLRVLVLHLRRIAERASKNRMSSGELATVWAPTLMGVKFSGEQTKQVIVMQTILDNCYEIFDVD